jgi:hypothetical protein
MKKKAMKKIKVRELETLKTPTSLYCPCIPYCH